jgi:hypothetical protein
VTNTALAVRKLFFKEGFMKRVLFGVSVFSVVAIAVSNNSCSNAEIDSNPNRNTVSVNSMVPPVNVNSTPIPTPVAINPVVTNEPEQYSATMRLTAERANKTAALHAIEATVARDGAKRRIAFILPTNEQVVYLNLGKTRYVILPNRRQYAEINRDTVGFEMPRRMMPDQIIEYLKGRQGFEPVGEEQMNGRTVVKYRASGRTQSNTVAGQVTVESFTYVDNETGLPVRTEIASEATGNVQDVRAVIEMRNIKTDLDPALFEIPAGYSKITEEQIRSQATAVIQAITALAGALANDIEASPSPDKR